MPLEHFVSHEKQLVTTDDNPESHLSALGPQLPAPIIHFFPSSPWPPARPGLVHTQEHTQAQVMKAVTRRAGIYMRSWSYCYLLPAS